MLHAYEHATSEQVFISCEIWGSHSGEYENYSVTSLIQTTIFFAHYNLDHFAVIISYVDYPQYNNYYLMLRDIQLHYRVPHIFSVALIIWTFINLEKGSLPISPN